MTSLSDTARAHTRIAWPDALRGFAILLVILHHTESQVRSNIGDIPSALVVFNDAFAPFRMPTLMLLSGLLLARSLSKSPGVYIDGKLRKIAWPYLLWSFALLGLIAASSRVTGNTSANAAEFLRVFYAPPTYLWYLAYLLVFYAVGLALRSRPSWRDALPVVAMSLAFVLPQDDGGRLAFLAAFFFLGDALGRRPGAFDKITHGGPLAVALVVGLTASAFSIAGVRVNYQPEWCFGVLAGVVALLGLTRALTPRVDLAALRWVGEQSIVFYCSHFMALMVAFEILTRAGIGNALLLAVALPVIAIVVGALLAALRTPRGSVPALTSPLFEFPRLR